jgi:hypothetical protein
MEHEEMNDDTAAPSAGSEAEQAEATSGGPPEPPPPPTEDSGPSLAGQVAAGLALVVLGGALLALERLDGSPDHLFLILVGGVFAAGYFYKRAFGLLIPGGILIGLGSGLAYDDLYSDSFLDGESAAFGLGIGFLLIYVVSLLYERTHRWWPLIPGGLLVIAGFPDWDWADEILDFWPVAVMAVGLLLLFRGLLSRQKAAESRRFDP